MWAPRARLGRHPVPHLTVPSFFENMCTNRAQCWERDAHRRPPGGLWRALRKRGHAAHGRRPCIRGLYWTSPSHCGIELCDAIQTSELTGSRVVTLCHRLGAPVG